MNKRVLKIVLRIFFGVLLAAAVLTVMVTRIPWDEARTQIEALRWWNIAFIVGIVMLMSVTKAIRFFNILRFGGISVSLRNTIRIFVISQAFTPMPAGEVGRAFLFKKELDVDMNEIAGPVLLQALMELWCATAWVIVLAPFVGVAWGGWSAVVFVLLLIFTAPMLFSKSLIRSLDAAFARGIRFKWLVKLRETLDRFKRLISSTGKHRAWKFWVYTLGSGLLVYLMAGGLMKYVASLVGIDLTFAQSIFITAMGALIQGIFTIIPGGLGVTEGGIVGVFSRFAIPLPQAIIATLIYRLATFPLLIIIAGIFLLLTYGRVLLRYLRSRAT